MNEIIVTREHMEGLTDIEVKELANRFGEKCQRSARITVIEAIQAGHALNIMKDRVTHGDWSKWLGVNWDYDKRTAQTYMALSLNAKRFVFEKAGSIREAMKMIADEKAESEPDIVPRSERKPADVVVTKPSETVYRDDSRAATTEGPPDDDPAPKPPTNRKTAKGSEKVSEDKKPKTQTVVPEILPDEQTIEPRDDSEIITEWLTERGLTDIISDAIDAKPKLDPKTAAKVLRKHADKLDPPDESKPVKIPTITQLNDATPQNLGVLQLPVAEWIGYKQKHTKKECRYQSIESWQKDLKRMQKVATEHGEAFVSESIDRAIAKGWRGWEQDSSFNGKANGNGTAHRGNSRRPGPTAESVFGIQ